MISPLMHAGSIERFALANLNRHAHVLAVICRVLRCDSGCQYTVSALSIRNIGSGAIRNGVRTLAWFVFRKRLTPPLDYSGGETEEDIFDA